MKRTGFFSLILSLTVALGCTGSLEPVDGEFGDGDGDGDGDVDAGTPSASEMQFRMEVEPLIAQDRPLMSCAVCHIGDQPIGGAIFGATAAASYQAILTGYTANPAAGSELVTKGAHSGNAFCTGAGAPYPECTQDEITIITNWIAAEIAAGNVQ